MVHLSPGLRASEPYPFEELDRRKAAAIADGRPVVDFGVGDPREETPAFIREAMKDAIGPTSSYPRAAGLPELRGAIASWVERRFGVTLDPDVHILPTLGSKEPIFSLAQSLLDPRGRQASRGGDEPRLHDPRTRRTVRRGRRRPSVAHRGQRIPPRPRRRGCVHLEEDRRALVELPEQPHGGDRTARVPEKAADHCRSRDVLLASDEAYSELWFEGDPPASVLQVGDLTNVLAFHTLSKRSSMTGYRSGFVAGDPEMIAALRGLRPAVGVTPQEFVQRASVAAWNDEAHVEETRAIYGRKRKLFLDLFASRGLRVPGERSHLLSVGRRPRRAELARVVVRAPRSRRRDRRARLVLRAGG